MHLAATQSPMVSKKTSPSLLEERQALLIYKLCTKLVQILLVFSLRIVMLNHRMPSGYQ